MKLKLLAGIPVTSKDGTQKTTENNNDDIIIENVDVKIDFVGIRRKGRNEINLVPSHELKLIERKDYDTSDEFKKGDRVLYKNKEYVVEVPDARDRLVGIKRKDGKKVRLVLADELKKVNESIRGDNPMITVGKVGKVDKELVIVEKAHGNKIEVLTIKGLKKTITPKDFKPVKVKKSKYLKEALYQLTGIVPSAEKVLTEDHFPKGEIVTYKPTGRKVKVLRSVRGKQDNEQYLVQDEKTLDVFVANATDLVRKKVAESLSVVYNSSTLDKEIVIKKENEYLTVYNPNTEKVSVVNENAVVVTDNDPLFVLLKPWTEHAKTIVEQWKRLNEQDIEKLVVNDPKEDKNESPEQLNALSGGRTENQPPQDTEVKIDIPRDVLTTLDREIKKAEQAVEQEVDLNAGNKEAAVQYKNLARAFRDIKRYLEKGTVQDVKKAQIYISSLYTPILAKVPANVINFVFKAIGGLKKDWYSNQMKEVK